MKLLLIPFKNAVVNWWRTITLGLFVFIIGIIMALFGAFNMTVKNHMQNAIINGLTGHLQIRPAQAAEEDMADMMQSRLKGTSFLPADTTVRIEDALRRSVNEVTPVRRIRIGGLLMTDTEEKPTLLIGLDPKREFYRKALALTDGEFLKPGQPGEIIIPAGLAETLRVKAGDSLGILCVTKDGYPVDRKLKVAGVTQFKMLSLFGFAVSYTDYETARTLGGFKAGEATDILLYAPDKRHVSTAQREVTAALQAAGVPVVSSHEGVEAKEGAVRLSSYEYMGGFYMGIVNGILALFYILLILLFTIVGILIANLVYMMGIERYREIATLRAIGFSKRTTIFIFMSEILIIVCVFGLLGIGLGMAVNLYFSVRGMPSPSAGLDYMMGKRIFFQNDYLWYALTFFIIAGFTLAVSFFPAWRACSLRPATALKDQ